MKSTSGSKLSKGKTLALSASAFALAVAGGVFAMPHQTSALSLGNILGDDNDSSNSSGSLDLGLNADLAAKYQMNWTDEGGNRHEGTMADFMNYMNADASAQADAKMQWKDSNGKVHTGNWDQYTAAVKDSEDSDSNNDEDSSSASLLAKLGAMLHLSGSSSSNDDDDSSNSSLDAVLDTTTLLGFNASSSRSED